MKMFDCCTPLTPETAASFKSNGYDGVARYLVPASSAWKALTKDEADIIQQAGMKIVSVYETTADRSLGDYQAGVSDAKTAMQCAQTVGQPTGSTIYFAVDFEPSDAQMAAIAGYFSGVHDSLVGYDVGVYGDYDVCVYLKGKGLVTHIWETYAWSAHMITADVNIYQNDNGPNGVDYDLDTSFGFEGSWGTGPTTVQPAPTPTKLDPGVALTFINTWAIPDWNKAMNNFKTTGTQAYKQQADYIHWLSNCLRDAAGLPLEDDKQ